MGLIQRPSSIDVSRHYQVKKLLLQYLLYTGVFLIKHLIASIKMTHYLSIY